MHLRPQYVIFKKTQLISTHPSVCESEITGCDQKKKNKRVCW